MEGSGLLGLLILGASASASYDIIRIGLGVIGGLGFLATGYAVIRTNLSSQTISNLEKNNSALHERVELIEKSGEVLKKENGGLMAQNAQQAQEISWLEDQVTGASAVAELTKLVIQHHADMSYRLDEIRRDIQKGGS